MKNISKILRLFILIIVFSTENKMEKYNSIALNIFVFLQSYFIMMLSKLNAMEKQEYEKSVLEYEDVKDAMEYHHRMGFAEGMEKGMEKGIEKGIEKGKETIRQIIAKMRENGLPITTIVKLSGLSEAEVLEASGEVDN